MGIFEELSVAVDKLDGEVQELLAPKPEKATRTKRISGMDLHRQMEAITYAASLLEDETQRAIINDQVNVMACLLLKELFGIDR